MRPALAVLLLVGVGVTAARRAGRDELAQCACDVAAACSQDATGGATPPGGDAPEVALLGAHLAPEPEARVALAPVEAPASAPHGTEDVLTRAPKTSPPTT